MLLPNCGFYFFDKLYYTERNKKTKMNDSLVQNTITSITLEQIVMLFYCKIKLT